MNDVLLLEEPQVVTEHVEEAKSHTCVGDHSQRLLAMRDAMDILSGKWKIQLIGLLLFKGKMRFTEILRSMDGIASKMLSKELQDLEANQLITRTVHQTKPVTVEYEITPYGRSLESVITEIVGWGLEHRKRIMND